LDDICHDLEKETLVMVTMGNTPYLSRARINYTGYTRENVDRITNTFRQKENEGTKGTTTTRTRVHLPKDCLYYSSVIKRCD
jgi:methylglyoxal synthase